MKAKKNNKFRKKIMLILIVLVFIYFVYNSFFDKINFNLNNKMLLELLVDNSNNIKNESNIKYLTKVIDMNIKDIINYEYKYFFNEKKSIPVINDNINLINKEPVVYIYNTHQTEKYYMNKYEPYNIVPTIMTTSYMLKERLEYFNIYSFVEENSVNKILKKNNWNYASSYKVTASFLKQRMKEYPSLNFFIDVHRDSVNKKISTIEINDINYARILFIVGLENENYEKNLEITKAINKAIEKKYPGLSRGIYKKKGPGVNGVYNQNLSPNCILIEFGSEKNTIDEVYNTVFVIGEILANFIGEQNEKL